MSKNCDGAGVVSYGASLEVKDLASSEWLTIGGLTDFNGPQTSRGEIDTTTLCSKAKEYVPDLKDNGTFTSTMQTRLGDPAQRLLVEGLDATAPYDFRLIMPDDGYGNGEVYIEFKAFVTAFPITGSSGAVITTSLTLRITGDVSFIFPASGDKKVVIAPSLLSESADNDGAISGATTVVVSGDTFAGDNGSELAGLSFQNVPDGLTAVSQKINSTTAIISFTGNATVHDAGLSVAIGLIFADAAFTTGPASAIAGTNNRQITINFI